MKKILIFILVALLPLFANAYDFEYGGIYYNILSSEVEYSDEYPEGLLPCEVTYEYDYESSYSGYIVIPEVLSSRWWSNSYKVVCIGERAFMGCQLDGISLPSTITRIGDSAFSGCNGISSQNIPEHIEYIGDNAFYGSSLSGSLTIPLSCKYVGNSAFFDTDITELSFDYTPIISICTIGNYAFGNCDMLRTVNLNGLFYHIGSNPFMRCDNLTEIEGWGGYTNNENTMGNLLLDGCLYSFTEKDGVRSLELICCPPGLDSFTSPNHYDRIVKKQHNLTSIGEQAFSGCTKITFLDIPSTVTKIKRFGLFIPADITDEKDYTYRRVNIPESVETMGQFTFGWFGYNWDIYLYNTHIKGIIESYPGDGSKWGTIHIPYGTKSSFDVEGTSRAFDIVDDIEIKANITIGSTGFATYCFDYPLDFSEVSGLKAYIASGFSPSTGKLVLTNVTEAPAGEGLYLVGEPGTYEVPFTETDMVYSNLLKGVTTATTISPTDGDYTNFILANGAHGVAFYSLSEAGELAAGKAYLQLPTASVSDVKAISVIFDDDEDAVLSIEEESQTQRIYNLQGQQVNAPKNGLYIINGKKVFIK